MTEKPTNPKDAVGIRKVPMSAVPAPVLMELGLAMMEGARKYGRHNYRSVGVRSSVYYDALMRHMMAWWEGEDLDPESGLPHPVKAMACLAVLRDSQMRGNLNDDRPPKSKTSWVSELNERAGALIDKIPDEVFPVTHVDLSWDQAANEDRSPHAVMDGNAVAVVTNTPRATHVAYTEGGKWVPINDVHFSREWLFIKYSDNTIWDGVIKQWRSGTQIIPTPSWAVTAKTNSCPA